jgi:hypothetical protein
MHRLARMTILAFLPMVLCACSVTERRIRVAEYEDKVYASWLGQCIGNMYGLAHENIYLDEPRTTPIEGWAEKSLKQIREYNGAFSDDDTDIEYVDLFLMEKYGPEPTYENVTEFWIRCINKYIWVANRSARDLMNQGYLPPLTGRKGLNPNWFQIDPQLVCEIWAATAPGMLDYAAAKADWAAKVTNDDWGTHPTIWYNTMYSAAFFESNPERLCQIGYEHLPAGSLFRQAIDDVRKWKSQHGADWVAVRKKIKEKYLDGKGMPEDYATSGVGAILNGALGVMALLYGQGDFEKTINMACMAGYDADNQTATLAGLIALAKGSASIPRKYTHVVETWTLPLNDFYKNRTRDDLPDGKLTDMAARTAKIGRDLVLLKGGRIGGTGPDAVMLINAKARFVAPLEIRLFPMRIQKGVEVTVKAEISGGPPGESVRVLLAGTLPPGLSLRSRGGLPCLTGVPTEIGEYPVGLVAVSKSARRESILPVFVDPTNYAKTAEKVIAAVIQPPGDGSKSLNSIRDGSSQGGYDSLHGESPLAEDFYGYTWAKPVAIGRIVFRAGKVRPSGGWFETLTVQFLDGQTHWVPAEQVRISPDISSAQYRREGRMQFDITFKPVTTAGIRIVGKPGGSAQFTSIAELEVYER